jgi:hypothetical protein
MWGVSKKMLCVLNSFIIPSLSLARSCVVAFFFIHAGSRNICRCWCRCRFPARYFYSSRDIVKSFPPFGRIIDNESATQKKNVNPPPNYSFQFPFFYLCDPKKKKNSFTKMNAGFFFLYFFITNQTTTKKRAGDFAAFLKCFWENVFIPYIFMAVLMSFCDLLASNGRDLPQTFFGWAADFLRSNWWNVVVVVSFSFLFFAWILFYLGMPGVVPK